MLPILRNKILRRPYLLQDILQWAYGMNWAKTRCQCVDFFSDDDEDDYFGTEDDEGVEDEVDSYTEVDEYEWSHVN